MLKSITVAAVAGTLAIVAFPAFTTVAFAQAAAGPEPMQGAQPADAGAMEKGGDSGSMEKGSMKKHAKHSKHMTKHKKSM